MPRTATKRQAKRLDRDEFMRLVLLRLPARWLELPEILAKSPWSRERTQELLAELDEHRYIDVAEGNRGPWVWVSPVVAADRFQRVLAYRRVKTGGLYQTTENILVWRDPFRESRKLLRNAQNYSADWLDKTFTDDYSRNTAQALSHAETKADTLGRTPRVLLEGCGATAWWEIPGGLPRKDPVTGLWAIPASDRPKLTERCDVCKGNRMPLGWDCLRCLEQSERSG